MSAPIPVAQDAPENRLTPLSRLCEHCGAPLPGPGRGEPRRFCSTRCRRLGWLARQRAEAVAEYHAKVIAAMEAVAGVRTDG